MHTSSPQAQHETQKQATEILAPRSWRIPILHVSVFSVTSCSKKSGPAKRPCVTTFSTRSSSVYTKGARINSPFYLTAVPSPFFEQEERARAKRRVLEKGRKTKPTTKIPA